MSEPQGATSGHESLCSRCGAEFVVPMAATRLERAPWRLVWRCTLCECMSQRRLPRSDALTVAALFDRPYGSQISIREAEDIERMSGHTFEQLLHATITDQV
jgi:hypothetical protein